MSNSLTPIVPFLDRHAPKVWSDMVFADQDTHDDLYEYAHHKRFGHIMLIGDVGTAKSTTAKMIVATRQALNGMHGGLIEFIKAERIKADPEVLFDAISAMSTLNGNDFNPYVIVDDFDCVPLNQQPRVRAEMEQMQAGRLIFTVNDITKIDRSIVDRCDCYDVPCPSGEQMLARAQNILRAEGASNSDAKV